MTAGRDVLRLPATDLQQLLLRRSIGATELLRMTFERIERDNPALNAIVEIDRDAALDAAAESDRRIAAGTARPLEGLPVTIKDSFDVERMPATSGSKLYVNRPRGNDAPAVARLREAGAVIFGKTNVSEMLGDLQSYNPVYGATSNPVDTTRTAGGSSGGSAAAIATGMSALDLGSDLCGSIRWPAHCCGVFGLKPTWGSVPMFGHVPPPPGSVSPAPLSAGGPLARSARDLALAFSVLSGGAMPRAPVEPKTLRIAIWIDEPLAPVDPSVSEAVMRAAEILQSLGAVVDFKARPSFSFADAFEVFATQSYSILALGLSAESKAGLAATALGYDRRDLSHPALRARGAALDHESMDALMRRRAEIVRGWSDFFARFDAVLCPPAPVAAIAHDHSGDVHARSIVIAGQRRPYFDLTNWCCLASAADLPAAVAPVSQDASGLPIGVQIVGAHGAEPMTLAIAELLEPTKSDGPH